MRWTIQLLLFTGLVSGTINYTRGDPDYDDYESGKGLTFHPEGASPGFQCRYPKFDPREWEACNTPNSRACWIRQKYDTGDGLRYGYDLYTDFDDHAPVGVARYYTIDVGLKVIYPDGVPKHAKVFNGQFPGPQIEACWGDELVITVINNLPDQGTTVHWHGVRQLHTNDMDGVASTQCPIPRGHRFTYRYRVTQYGTSWYHSHYRLQYADGLAGPLTLYGPSSANYDIAIPDTFLMSDWIHDEAYHRFEEEKDPVKRGTAADNILLNGHGIPVGTIPAQGQPIRDLRSFYTTTHFIPGKRHRLRLCNGSAGTTFVFSIDGHNFTVIQNDFVPVKPFVTNSIVVGIGQRYDIIVHGLRNPGAPGGNYWMRFHPADGCNRFQSGIFNSKARPRPSLPLDVRLAVVHYTTPKASFAHLPSTQSSISNFECSGHATQSALVPVVPWRVDRRPLNDLAQSTFYNAHQTEPDATLGRQGHYAHWQLRMDPVVERKTGRQRHSPFWIDFANPTILNVTEASRSPGYGILRFPYHEQNKYIFMVIDGALLPGTSHKDVNGTFIIPPTAHPMHWHGVDVVILGQSHRPFDPKTSPATWQFNNPPRRDTVMAPAGGYVAVAFRPDNPGVWLIHCHIAWHASAGLALQMIIQADDTEIYRTIGRDAVNSIVEGCRAYDRDLVRPDLPPYLEKDDSGI